MNVRKGTTNGPSNIDLELVNQKLTDCPDIIRKKVYIEGKHEAYFIYFRGLVDTDLVQRDFIRPIISMGLEQLSDVNNVNLPCAETSFLHDSKAVVDCITKGNTVFICNDLAYAISCTVTGFDKRAVEEPVTEKNIRGPHEGFIETLQSNISMLRRKIKNKNLKFRTVILGSETNQEVAIAYIEGIANIDIVNRLYEKISKVNLDGLNAIGYLEQAIITHPHSLFPQLLATERPDRAAASLLEGRLVLLQEGTPVVLIAPVNFFSFFQALDDYSTQWIHGSFLRLLRFVGLVIALVLPSLYIAVTSYHYYAVPLNLLIPLAESRSKVPFPPIIEVLILEITVELIREAAVRLPTYIGTTISVVVGLIIGQAIVEANVVSNLLIVIVAATAIASYVIPVYDMSFAVRLLRFAFSIAASIFGIIGIIICVGLTLTHLVTLESLGQPYFQPFSPLQVSDLKDTLIRLPLKFMKRRPRISKPKDDFRGKENARK